MCHSGRMEPLGGVLRRAVAVASVVLLLITLAITSPAPASAAESIAARGSVNQVYATGLSPGATVTLRKGGTVVATQTVSSLGGVLFREVPVGTGYVVHSEGDTSPPVTVYDDSSEPWDTSFYNQTIAPNGYQYITTRDGTQLALTVHPPNEPAGVIDLPPIPSLCGLLPPPLDVLCDLVPLLDLVDLAPPHPTLIEYSGYATADPAGPKSGIAALANLMGFAVVDVSMRGTGCSGGAFDFFEPLQALDGYDVIEVIARQSWVDGDQVGMLGISYGGISQLFTAATQPPSLAAITPLSVIDSVPATLYPGGIRNDGFAVAWAEERQVEAQPAGQGFAGTHSYAEARVAGGDQTCIDNQVLHPEAAHLMTKIEANATYVPEVADPLDPISFVDRINVPVFMACQWQDEQTGGHCPTLAQRMTGTDKKWFTFTNGVHTDSLDPETFVEMFKFLSIYVAERSPITNAVVLNATAPVIYQTAFGVPETDLITLPLDDLLEQLLTLSYAQAKANFEAQPQVRVLFNNGANPGLTSQPGSPGASFEMTFDSFPPPQAEARSWYFGADETMRDAPPPAAVTHSFVADPWPDPLTNFAGGTAGGGLWGNRSQWSWDWRGRADDTSLSYLTEPLVADHVVVGSGAVEFWARSQADDVDFQVTISEVDANGNETFVQGGWVRGSLRAMATDADNPWKLVPTETQRFLTLREADRRPMPDDEFTKVVVPIYFHGHPYRAGTRIRVVISAPNGDQPIWSFEHPQPASGTTTVDVQHGAASPGRLVLPVIAGATAPAGQPECGVLRNQPCRPFAPTVNTIGGRVVPAPPGPGDGGDGSDGDDGDGGHGDAGGPVIVPVAPRRYLDTRGEDGVSTGSTTEDGGGRLAAGGVVRVPVAGVGEVPADAVGVVANVTVVTPDAPGHATVYPCTPTVPLASHLNYRPGDILANNVVVPLSADGELCIATHAAADFVVDVNGFVPAGSPLGLFTPARYLDTRVTSGATGGLPVAAGAHATVRIAGVGEVPGDAAAAVVNVTAVVPEGNGYVTVYPCVGDPKAASSLNYLAGEVVPNGAIVDLSDDGTICVFTLAAAHLVVDIAGFVPAGAERLRTTAPTRLFDSRPDDRFAVAGMTEIRVAGRAGVAPDATAAILNVVTVEPDGPGYVTLWPCGTRPRTSNLNHATAGVVRANNAITKLSADGTVCVFSLVPTHIVVDTTGWIE